MQNLTTQRGAKRQEKTTSCAAFDDSADREEAERIAQERRAIEKIELEKRAAQRAARLEIEKAAGRLWPVDPKTQDPVFDGEVEGMILGHYVPAFLRYDRFNETPLVINEKGEIDTTKARSWEEYARKEICEHFGIKSRNLRGSWLCALAQKNECDPLCSYVEECRVAWIAKREASQGENKNPVFDRIDALGPTIPEYAHAVAFAWFCGLVGRWIWPGIYTDIVLGLSGPQNIQKTYFFTSLLPLHMRDACRLERIPAELTAQRRGYETRGVAIWVSDEARDFGADSKKNGLKEEITKTSDVFDCKGVETVIKRQRRFVFGATSNDNELLLERGRRFQFVQCEKDARESINIEENARDCIGFVADYLLENKEKIATMDPKPWESRSIPKELQDAAQDCVLVQNPLVEFLQRLGKSNDFLSHSSIWEKYNAEKKEHDEKVTISDRAFRAQIKGAIALVPSSWGVIYEGQSAKGAANGERPRGLFFRRKQPAQPAPANPRPSIYDKPTF